MGAADRLALAARLLTTRGALGGEMPAEQRVLLGRQAASLREKLTGEASPAAAEIDLRDPDSAIGVVLEKLRGLEAMPDGADRRTQVEYLRLIYQSLSHTMAKMTPIGAEWHPKWAATSLAVHQAPGIRDAEQDEILAQMRARGAVVHEAKEKLAADSAEHDRLKRVLAELTADGISVAQHKATEATSALKQAATDYMERYTAFDSPDRPVDQEKLAAVRIEARRLNDEYYAEWHRKVAEFKAEEDKQIEPFAVRYIEAKDKLESAGGAIIRAARDTSPVSEVDAKLWADDQEIGRAAANALKRVGYEPDDVRADMAEFYRLTGGRLASVKIRASGKRRASAEEIHGHRTSIINLGQRFSKQTLFHELGHHLEADPAVLAAARAFLRARRKSDKLVRLSNLVPGSRYGRDEVAYEDSWVDPYVGKFYKDATEVISMGMEAFSNPKLMAQRVAKDPDHVALIYGFVSVPASPLFDTVKQVFKQRAEAETEAQEESEAEREDAIAALVKAAAPGPVDQKTADDHKACSSTITYGMRNGEVSPDVQVGDVILWEAKKIRDPKTNRKKKGHYLSRGEPRDARGMDYNGIMVTVLPVLAGREAAIALALAWSKMPVGARAPRDIGTEALKKAAKAYGQ
jgi:hypothetical protein